MNKQVKAGGAQSVYSADGEELFSGEWDPLKLLSALGDTSYWSGRTVLDLGANTSGLSVELARLGAKVTAAEPDPYKNTRAAVWDILQDINQNEQLGIKFVEHDLYGSFELRGFDTVLCLGLMYHFRDPQHILDSLNAVTDGDLFLSTQTAPGSDLMLVNRKQEGVLKKGHLPEDIILTGWHPTRPLLERMLEWAGFGEISALTDEHFNFPHKPEGLTNSAYYRATKKTSIDPLEEMKKFYPR